MKKLIIFISILAVLMACAVLSINAEEVAEVTDKAIVTTVAPENVVPTEDTDSQVLISEIAKEFVDKYLAEIASIAGFIVTIILTFLYKKGLLPVVSNGFAKLAEILNLFKGNMEDRISAFGDEAKPIIEQMNKTIERCTEMEKKFNEISELLKIEQEEKKMLEDKIARSDERDMLTCELLCQILMCANVPQYMKDKVATYYETTKATINGGKAVSDNEDVA